MAIDKTKDQKYNIIKKLDAGGMAEVFQAEMETVKGFKKTVAIKRIKPNLTKDDRYAQMFMDEAKLSLYLQHANIASVFDVGKTDKHFFIVMEFVEGLNLKVILELLGNRQLPINIAVYIILNVCEALDYAHNLKEPSTGKPFNIVHRDISPPNILISKQGEIKLVDFGLAKASSQSEKSDPGLIKGKYAYLSPEAAAGLEVDHRTDIFASGIILFELLTGQRLFLGKDNYETVTNVQRAVIPPLSQYLSKVPDGLQSILNKALQRDPEKRYLSASDLGDDLTKFLYKYGEPVTKRDIAALSKNALEIKKKKEPSMLISRDSLLKEFIEEELNQIISIGEIEDDENSDLGATPIDFSSMGNSIGIGDSLEQRKSSITPGFTSSQESSENSGIPENSPQSSLGTHLSPNSKSNTNGDSSVKINGSISNQSPQSDSNKYIINNEPISFARTTNESSSNVKIFLIFLSIAAILGGSIWYFFIK